MSTKEDISNEFKKRIYSSFRDQLISLLQIVDKKESGKDISNEFKKRIYESFRDQLICLLEVLEKKENGACINFPLVAYYLSGKIQVLIEVITNIEYCEKEAEYEP